MFWDLGRKEGQRLGNSLIIVFTYYFHKGSLHLLMQYSTLPSNVPSVPKAENLQRRKPQAGQQSWLQRRKLGIHFAKRLSINFACLQGLLHGHFQRYWMLPISKPFGSPTVQTWLFPLTGQNSGLFDLQSQFHLIIPQMTTTS